MSMWQSMNLTDLGSPNVRIVCMVIELCGLHYDGGERAPAQRDATTMATTTMATTTTTTATMATTRAISQASTRRMCGVARRRAVVAPTTRANAASGGAAADDDAMAIAREIDGTIEAMKDKATEEINAMIDSDASVAAEIARVKASAARVAEGEIDKVERAERPRLNARLRR